MAQEALPLPPLTKLCYRFSVAYATVYVSRLGIAVRMRRAEGWDIR